MRRSLQDLAALAARTGVGGIFFAHGWQKLQAGLINTGEQFAGLHVPMPALWAGATMLIELGGGALLIAGLAVPAIGLLLFAEAVAVFAVAAGDAGLPLAVGDVRLLIALGAASVLLAVTGAGRASVDHMVVIKRRETEESADRAAGTGAGVARDPKHDEPAREPAHSGEASTAAPAEPRSPGDTGTGGAEGGSAESPDAAGAGADGGNQAADPPATTSPGRSATTGRRSARRN